MLRQRTVSYDFISGIAFKTRNKKDTGVIPLGKEVKVIVAPIHSHNTPGGKREMRAAVTSAVFPSVITRNQADSRRGPAAYGA